MTIFPYQRNSTGDSFPVVDLFVSKGNHIARIFALIDSGATVSVFKEEVAKQLGIDIEKGKVIHLGGVGGHIKGYQHEVKIEVKAATYSQLKIEKKGNKYYAQCVVDV